MSSLNSEMLNFKDLISSIKNTNEKSFSEIKDIYPNYNEFEEVNNKLSRKAIESYQINNNKNIFQKYTYFLEEDEKGKGIYSESSNKKMKDLIIQDIFPNINVLKEYLLILKKPIHQEVEKEGVFSIFEDCFFKHFLSIPIAFMIVYLNVIMSSLIINNRITEFKTILFVALVPILNILIFDYFKRQVKKIRNIEKENEIRFLSEENQKRIKDTKTIKELLTPEYTAELIAPDHYYIKLLIKREVKEIYENNAKASLTVILELIIKKMEAHYEEIMRVAFLEEQNIVVKMCK